MRLRNGLLSTGWNLLPGFFEEKAGARHRRTRRGAIGAAPNTESEEPASKASSAILWNTFS